jgi:hypothetical protein
MAMHVKATPSAHSMETAVARIVEHHRLRPAVTTPLAKVDALLEAAVGGPP